MSDRLNKRSSFFTHDFSKLKTNNKPNRSIPISNKELNEFLYHTNRLMEAQSLLDPQVLLTATYFLCVQPALERCLVITQDSSTYIFSVNGKLLTKSPTSLPNHELSIPNTILEGYYSNYAEVFIQDILLWNTEDFRNRSASDRFAFIAEKLCSLTPSALKFTPVIFLSCTFENICRCYEEKNIHGKEALLFYKATGCYESAFSVNKLMWYDQTFQYGGRDRSARLECRADGSLFTADGVRAYSLSKEEAQRLEIYTGRIVECVVGECGAFEIKSASGFFVSSGRATSWSRIFFDWKVRNNMILVDRFEEVMNSMDICNNSNSQENISDFNSKSRSNKFSLEASNVPPNYGEGPPDDFSSLMQCDDIKK